MDDAPVRRIPKRERNTVFALAALILVGIVSISFYNLDRHPAFFEPSEEFIGEVDELQRGTIFAADPVALAAIEQHQHRMSASVRPLTSWPPEASVFAFGSVPRHYETAGMERVAGESVWSLWRPADAAQTPRLSTAVVEVVSPDGTTQTCSPDLEGAHQCGRAGWTRVRMRDITVDGSTESCIWAHPMDRKTVRIRFPQVSLDDDDGRELWLETALRDQAVGTGTPVLFTVHFGDHTTTHRLPDRRGWHDAQIPADDTTDELIVDVEARDVGRRHSCFRFDLR